MNKLIYGQNSVTVADPKAAVESVIPVLRKILEGWGFNPKAIKGK